MALPPATARSMLAFPVEFAVSTDAGPVPGVIGLDDADGRPLLMCAPDSGLPGAARSRTVAHLRLRSAWPTTDPEVHLGVTGRLRLHGHASCECCDTQHPVVALEPAAVLLTRGLHRTPVPLGDFLAADHQLGPGYLARVAHHANHCHAAELRRTASLRTGVPARAVAAASVTAITREELRMSWVDVDGAHDLAVPLAEQARDRDHLGHLLRDVLGPDLC